MEKIRYNNIFIFRDLTFKFIHFSFFLLLFLIQMKGILLVYFESFQTGMLEDTGSFIDISDYYNLYPIITADKNIYLGIPPTYKVNTNSSIIEISSAVTYNNNYILIACTQNYLLSVIDIETGNEDPLVSYDNMNIPDSICSISYKDNYVYIGFSHKITPIYAFPKKLYNLENINDLSQVVIDDKSKYMIASNTDLSEIIHNDSYYIYYDYNNAYLQSGVKKIKLVNGQPILDQSFIILNYTFSFKDKYLDLLDIRKSFSCEIIDTEEGHPRLVCGHVRINKTESDTLHYCNASLLNSDFTNIEDETHLDHYSSKKSIRLQRDDSTHIKYILTNFVYIITLNKEGDNYKLVAKTDVFTFLKFFCVNEHFFYNNGYLFTLFGNTMYIKKSTTGNYITAVDSVSIKKIIGYYNQDEDKLLFLYATTNKIKYFTLQNMYDLFHFETRQITKEVISGTTTTIDINDLITSPTSHELLSLYSLSHFISITEANRTYDKYTFDKDSHNLTIQPSLNDWVTFNFYFDGETTGTTGITTGFHLNKTVAIKTCLFKCGKCYSDFSVCDDDADCKANFTRYRDSSNIECYPNDQNFPNYIYNQTTNYFEKCYSRCKFCSLMEEISSSSSHNCKVCEEGYIRSYRYLGNCYKIDYPYNSSEYFKIVNNIDDEYFTQVDSCHALGKMPINNTGECVDTCPNSSVYYTYKFNESLDFSQQQETTIGFLYPMYKENIPRFLFNNVCYTNCPKMTYQDSNNNVCRCNHGWHYNTTTNETICYDKDSCLSLDYYYHTDNRQCILDGCKNNYYQFNFECYKTGCPINTIKISPDSYICQSIKKYCIINENYKTKCSDTPYQGYNLKYNDTNLYFKSCNESLDYFNVKTYLYKNTCYEYCPDGTTENEENNRCSCNNYIHYINERTDYECFETESDCALEDLYFDRGIKECFESEEICFNLSKKILGKECIFICPRNSEEKDNSKICECLYYYYNNNGTFECFDNGVTCESKGYLIKSDCNKECFFSINDCLSKNNSYFFDDICYKNNCPNGMIPLNTVENADIQTGIINKLNLNDSNAEKACVCNIPNDYGGWLIKESNPSAQYCLDSCPSKFNIDPVTSMCYYECDPNFDFVFNDICYKNDCPGGTRLKDPTATSGECSCENAEKEDPVTGLITCSEDYPDLFYNDRKSCPYIYNSNCVLECPSGTCLTTLTEELVKCVDFQIETMIIINDVCIEGIGEYAQTINNFQSDGEILPIKTPSGVVLNAFSVDASLEELIEKNPNLTFIELGECKQKLIEAYNLPQNTKLYIIGIDIPELYGNSSINNFDYEVFLKNGTQLDDFSSCDGLKILVSSKINNVERVNYYKALDFHEESGYDIYNITDLFYMDYCAPAHDEENDITLEDRMKYYYPNVSLCNEGCLYKQVDFDKQRFVCHCSANLTETNLVNYEQLKQKNEEDQTYIEYFLSLINYRIICCYKLFFEFKSFYSNVGFYISMTTSLLCLVLFFVFWIKGLKYIRIIMYNNIPTIDKLKDIIKKQRRKMNYISDEELDANNNDDCSSNNNIGNNITSDFKIDNKESKQIIVTNELSPVHNNNSNNNNNNKSIKTNRFPPPKVDDINKKSLFLQDIDFGKYGEKEVEIFNVYRKNEKGKSKKKYYEDYFKRKKKKKQMGCSSKDNLIHMYNKYVNENKKNIKYSEEVKRGKSTSNIKINIFNINENIKNKNIQNIQIQPKTPEDHDSKEFINSSLLNRMNRKTNTNCSKKNKLSVEFLTNKSKKENNIPKIQRRSVKSVTNYKKKVKDNLELKIDFNFEHLIDRTDEEVEKRELNNIPYRQALRVDKRPLIEIFFSVFVNEVEILNLFLYRNPYSHFSLTISIYVFELLLDLTMNCVLYTDDVVSEKYHNNGELSMITSLSLSLMSNIISSFIVYIISKLTNYCEIIEAIIKNVKYRQSYFQNIVRLFKYIKIRLGLFYFFQLNLLLLMTYYLFIFCTIYHKSQGSIMINYLIGASTSLAISTGLTLIITLLRALSIKFHSIILFNVSKYLYEHF